MQIDPDLQRPQPQQYQQPYTNNVYFGGSQVSSAYAKTPSGGVNAGSVVMAIFTSLNLFFLIVAAGYSLGIFETVEATTDGASFFIVAIMTLLSAGLGLLCSLIGLRMSRLAHSSLFVLVHKILIIAVIIAAVLIFVGPIFR